MIESIVTDAVKLLLSQTISLYKTKKKEKALENNLSILLNDVAEEPFYDDICKLIETGALKKQLIRYCENVPLDGPTIAKRCSDIANACNGDSFNQSRIYDIIFKISVSFFYIINEPDNSEIKAVINYSNLNTATIREDIQKLADMISEFMKWQFNKTDVDEPKLQIPKFINPPYPKNDYFSNRKDILDEIHKGFSSGATIQYLTGQSGIGKTQIALEYAFRNEADYSHILWVNAETETKIMESYQKFIDTLQLLSVPKEEQSNAVIIRNVFRWMDTHDNWLFIYDNIEDVTGDIPWCPKCNRGNCLFTTQKKDLEFGNKFEVTEFSPDEAVRFLEKRTKKRDTDTMKDVAKRLGYHPLALEQAAAYLVHNKNTTFAAYSQLLTKHGLTALEETKDKDIINYHKSVTATMEISIAKIKTEAAIQLLYLCSYLSSENIDPNLFYKTSELLPDPLQTQLSDTLTRNRVWRALTEYSLFAFHEEKDGYSVHRLLQEVIRRQIGEDQQWAQHCLAILRKVFDFEYGNIPSHSNFIQRLPHVEAFLNHTEFYLTDQTAQEEIANLYAKGGWGHIHLGNYTQAMIWYQKALVICEKVLGKEHPDTAATYNNIAMIYDSQGEYSKALEWYQKALAIREKVLGKKHPSTAVTYNNIAMVYDSQGEYAKALEWYQKALVIREKMLGKEHPDAAATYNNIALVYAHQGEYAKALEWHQKALAIREKVPGKEHPDTAATYNNTAAVYEHQGEYAKALEWHQKALAIRENVLGKEHPSTATTYNNIAIVYTRQGEYAKALEWHQKALAIREKVLGKEHPDTAVTYNNIAAVYYHQSEYSKALAWFEKAYPVFTTKLGKDHPNTKTTAENMWILQEKMHPDHG